MDSDSSENDYNASDNDAKRRQSGGNAIDSSKTTNHNKNGTDQKSTWTNKTGAQTEELVETAASKQNWKGIIISLVVILAVCLLITIAVLLMTPGKVEKDTRKVLTFENFIHLEGTLKLPHYTWISGNEYAHLDDKLGVTITNAEIPEKNRIVVPHQILKTLDVKEFSFSPDMKYALLEYDKEEIFRHSYRAKYQLYDLANGQLNPLGPNYPSQGLEDTELRCVSWSPTDHKLVFVHHNNIYYLPDALSTPVKITENVPSEQIYNGIPDWLYEEEILMAPCSIYWSSQGKLLAYGRLNYSSVPLQPVILYGDINNIYPNLKMLPYPKVGENNPVFNIVIVDPLAPTNKVELKFPPLKSKIYSKKQPKVPVTHDKAHRPRNASSGSLAIGTKRRGSSTSRRESIRPFPESSDVPYYTDVTWIDEDYVIVNIMNRAQTVGQIQLCQSASGLCRTALNQQVYTRLGGWIDPINRFTIEHSAAESERSADGTADSEQFIRLFTILPRTTADGDQVNQVARITINKEKSTKGPARLQFVTWGPFEVAEISGHDPENDILYFVAAPLGEPGHRHFYSQNTSQDNNGLISTRTSASCLTCQHSSSNCEFNNPILSPNLAWCQLWCLGPGIPTMTIHPTSEIGEEAIINSLNQTENSGQIIYNNTGLKTFLEDKLLSTKMHLEIPAPNNYTYIANLVLPPHFKENNNQKYPLLVEMYGGPESQIVDSTFGITWSSFVSSYYNVVIARIDGRGSAYQGRKLMVEIYKNLGEKEVFDQIFAIKYILQKIPIIDHNNVAIWGWSFGGYLTSMILASPQSSGLIKCGIAVAPVVDWRYYDSAYSERYMGSLDENSFNYQQSSLLDKVENFQFHKYLLIHGTADDNVHFQHSAHLIKALVKENVQFDLMIYPDESHNLQGVTRHLYSKMTNFLVDQCFGTEFPAHTEQVKKSSSTNSPFEELVIIPI